MSLVLLRFSEICGISGFPSESSFSIFGSLDRRFPEETIEMFLRLCCIRPSISAECFRNFSARPRKERNCFGDTFGTLSDRKVPTERLNKNAAKFDVHPHEEAESFNEKKKAKSSRWSEESTPKGAVISEPVFLSKMLAKRERKEEKRAVIHKSAKKIIECTRAEFNHYEGTIYMRGKEDIPLASRYWTKNKYKNDWFIIRPTQRVMPHITQKFIRVREQDKLEILKNLVGDDMAKENSQSLIFCKDLSTVQFVSNSLSEHSLPNIVLSGKAGAFSGSEEAYRVFIGTNVASRGLDLPKLQHVINYDFPRHMVDLIHRFGCVGRCSSMLNCGVTSFIRNPWEVELVNTIELAVRLGKPIKGTEVNGAGRLQWRKEKEVTNEDDYKE